MNFALRNKGLIVSLLEKARLECLCSLIYMNAKVYSFTTQSPVTVFTVTQLDDLMEERRQRGCSEELLAELSQWHLARIRQN